VTWRTLVAMLAVWAVWAGQAVGAEGRQRQAPAPPPEVKYTITIDTSEVPELAEWAEKHRPTFEKWYPIIVGYLPSDGYTAPRELTITFRNMDGVAYASGTRIVCAAEWFKAHPDDEGAIVHELVHVVQQYRSRNNPGWLVEGVADYIRFFKYEPVSKRPRVNPARAKYTDSYRITGAFLNYVAANHDHEFVVRMNAAMRQGRYSPDLWKEFTGLTVDELWEEYIKTLQAQAPPQRR
jgi:hypothetical protein